jgi:hypothetical protein
MPPSSGSESNPNKQHKLRLKVACKGKFPTRKIEAVRSYEMSVNFYRTTRRHIPKIVLFWIELIQDHSGA